MKKILVVLLFAGFHSLVTAQKKENIKVTDMFQIKSAGNITVTDDGKKAAFTVMSIEQDTSKWEYKYITQIWEVATEGSKPRQLTFSKEGAAQPKWSHDGKQLAFVRNVDGKSQIFLMESGGGEAMQFTKSKYGANNPEWSKDGKHILYTAQIPLKDLLIDTLLNKNKDTPAWPFEKPGFTNNTNLKIDTSSANPDGNMEAIRNYLTNNEKDNKAKVFDKLAFQEESTTSSNITFNHIFIIDATIQSGAVKDITPGFYSFNNAHFIDDVTVLTEGDINETTHPDRTDESAIYKININGTGVEKILGKKDRIYTNAALSASGKWLAYTYSKTNMVTIDTLAIMLLNGKEEDRIDIPFDRNKQNLTWSKDENYLYFTSPSNGGVIINRYNTKSKKVEALTEVNSGVTSFAITDNKILYSKININNPSEIYLSDIDGKKEQMISGFNTSWIKSKQVSIPEKHTFINNKGMSVEYWVMKPTNFEAGKKFPLLLEIHGGPAAMWGPGETSMWHEYQYFCGKGYGVVYCNPRGSSGYGVDFLKGNVSDWGNGPTSDVLTALDKTVAEGWADTSKLVVSGGSYAGYLVAWIIAHDQRFKAACSQRGVYDLSTFFGEGNAWRLVPNYFGGYPWQKSVKELLDRESPITYVQNIITPYIMFHGENDLRTGVIQGEMLYKSLKVLGRPVEYVRHPGGTHELTRSGNNRQRVDQMLRTYEFFERYIH